MEFIKHKIIDLLKIFSKQDLKNFRKLISSPLYTNGRNYVQLLDTLVKTGESESSKINARVLYASLYPGKTYSSQTLKNRLSELFNLGEEFIVYRKLHDDNVEKDKIILGEYLNNNLYKLFEQKYKKTRKNVESGKNNDNKYRNISFLNGINLSLLNKRKTIHKRNLQYYERSIYSFCIFLIQMFQEGVEFKILEYGNMKIKSNVVEEIIDQLQIEETIKKFMVSETTVQLTVCLYYYMYKSFQNPADTDNYYTSRKIFKKLINTLTDEYKDEIYSSMISFCIIKQNEGIRKFQYELFKLYNEKLKQGLFSELKKDNYPVNRFRDYVFIGIELKKYKWTENFIKKYSKELPENSRDDEMNLSYAKLYFAERQFEKAIQHLNKIQGLNYLHYTDASVLKLCCYYEFNRIDDAMYELDKFRHYLKNHREIPEIHIVPNVNFIKVYQKLVNNKAKRKEIDLGFLKKEIVGLKFISKGEWLLEKIKN